MSNTKDRSLKELYDITDEIMEPEMTPVLEGSCRIQGPMNATELGIEKKTGSHRAEKRSARHSVKVEDCIKAESGTCNVCAAPCSSCMHFKRAGLCGSIKVEEELSNEVSRGKETSQCSLNDANLSSLKIRTCANQHSPVNETSILLNPSSSHDSFSENTESKTSFDRSTDVNMFPRVSVGGAAGHDELISEQQSDIRSQVTSGVGRNQYEEQKVVECNGDNISCVSGSNDADMPVRDLKVDVDRKNVACSTASISSVPEKSEKIIQFQSASGSADLHFENLDNSKSSKTNMLSKESTLNGRTISSENADTCHKSDDVLSPKDLSAGSGPHDMQIEKSSPLAEVPKTQDPPLESQSVNENDGSDIVEDDVKVCDICGDAGREDLLAVCSRCTDGAEHTYCMRIMMDKVPEGDWLCEGCQLKEEALKKKQDKVEAVPGTSQVSSGVEKVENSGSALNLKVVPKLNTELLDGEADKDTKVVPSPHVSSKRRSDNHEIAPAPKRLAVESTVGTPKLLSPSKRGALLRETSFKNLDKDKGKVKPIHPIPSCGGSVANNSQDLANIHAISTQNPPGSSKLISPRGNLLKSSSFSGLNSKPKVKPIQEVPQKHKLARNSSVSNTKKEGIVRTFSKSQSFRPGSTQSCSTESKVKLLSSNPSRAEDLKGLKAKERSISERKNSSISDRLVSPMATVEQKAGSRGESTQVLSSAANCRDPKAVQPDGKLHTASKLASSVSHKGAETPNALGRGDIKRQSSLLSCGAGYPSLNGNLADKKATQVSSKDTIVGNSSCTADRPSNGNNPNVVPQFSQSRESSNTEGKARDSSFNHPKQNVSSGVRSIRCQKCKEIGHVTQQCPNARLITVETSSSAARSSREVMERSTVSKDTAEAALLKRSAVCNKGKLFDQFDELPTPSAGLSSAVASKVQLSTSSFLTNLTSSDVERGHEIFKNSTTDSSRAITVTDVKLPASRLKEAICAPQKGDINETVPLVENNFKFSSSNFPRLASSVSVPSMDSPNPECEYIWQGGFEVRKNGFLVEFYDGIQAHLSTFASPKVPEVVNKFPLKILLEEVSRSSTWPMQFQNCVTEDNIALYIFPRDDESYARSYKILLENMIKNDLALKGNFDGIELLIFPSNQFPQESQRWNMFFFLWGVFRGKKLSCSDHISGFEKKLPGADLNVAPLEEASLEEESDIPDMVASRRECSSENLDEDLSNCGGLFKTQEAIKSSSPELKSTSAEPLPFLCSPGRVKTTCNKDESSMEMGSLGCIAEERVQERVDSSSGYEVTRHEKMKDKENISNDAGNPLLMKLPFSSSVDVVSQASAETSAGTSQPVHWGAPDNMLVDGESEQKMKRSYSDISGYNCSRDLSDGFLPQVQRPRLDGAYDNKVVQGSSTKTEMHFFPLDLFDAAKDCRPRENPVPVQIPIPVHILSSDDEDQLEPEVPNLELALGAEKKTPKQGVLPLFTVLAESKNRHGKCPETVNDDCDDDLSLSLSVPFSDKEKLLRPVPKPADGPFSFRGFSGS